MTSRFQLFAVVLLAAVAATASPVRSQDDRTIVMESLPAHLAVRVDMQRNQLSLASLGPAAEGVISRLKVWPVEAGNIRVCFFGGSTDLRSHIAKAASAWSAQPARIPLDFGDPQNPRSCLIQEFNHIRVGFSYSGYWSLVGQDSAQLASQNEASMNLGLFDVAPPPEPEFSRIVLHEFGHAIGFQHEHQSPFSDCESEFDWSAIYDYLGGPPNYWSRDRVDHNMRKLYEDDLVGTPFDPHSIMLYTFPIQFYRTGKESNCYSLPNYGLSERDLALAAELYPRDTQAAVANRKELVSTFAAELQAADTVSSQERISALARLQALASPPGRDTVELQHYMVYRPLLEPRL